LKKILVFILATIAVVVIFTMVNKSKYPDLPVASISPKEAIEKLNEADQQDLVEISKDDNETWYITEIQNGVSEVDEVIKKFISSSGWGFTGKDGSGLFFKKGSGETLIVTTEMWTTSYFLVKIPSHF
jgi:DNA phosphorothioation-dependent restriction protein DptG